MVRSTRPMTVAPASHRCGGGKRRGWDVCTNGLGIGGGPASAATNDTFKKRKSFTFAGEGLTLKP